MNTKNDNRQGYRGVALSIIHDAGACVGNTLTITSKDGATHKGLLMPRYEHDDDAHIVVKLDSGYNVGIDAKNIDVITVSTKEAARKITNDDIKKTEHAENDKKKRILLLSTGGTIASRVDYRTGGVTPVLSADELADAIPELAKVADVDAEVVTSEYSENITPEHWLALARRIDERSYMMMMNKTDNKDTKQPYSGIIIAHGTDTMHYTSAFLSFALAGFPAPIVLVGAQRSSDRASSDAATNLVAAARFITLHHNNNRGGGVYIAMHENTGDDTVAIHLGTRVRKSHTSRRDAFQTIGGKPALVMSAKDGSIMYDSDTNGFFASASYAPKISLDARVALVKYHPGYDPKILDYIIDSGYKAIIFEGTGLGHVGKTLYDQVARAAKSGIFLGMTSQCIDGRIAMTVYESGRDLASMGVTPLANMMPEVALVKAMWATANTEGAEGIKSAMLESMASEMSI